jgi:NAD(P)-dependent dehydrogenase (short-subunit alcohol dehydrogenase family)
MTRLDLEGKVAIVTGAGRGIGRAEALLLAQLGARVVVNDMGGSFAGVGQDERPAVEVCEEIRAAGGVAEPNFANVTQAADVEALVSGTIERFGRLDVVVNNAGTLRDAMVFSADPAEWMSVVDVHLGGHFHMCHYVTEHWRNLHKAGDVAHRSIVNTTSESGLFGNVGQSNYSAAKLGIVGLTMTVAKEMAKYGVTVNSVAPRARTRMTTSTFEGTDRAGEFAASDGGFDAMDPGNIAPVVAYLATDAAADINGQVFIVYGAAVGRVRLPRLGEMVTNDGRWTLEALHERRAELFTDAGASHFEGPRGYARMPKQ